MPENPDIPYTIRVTEETKARIKELTDKLSGDFSNTSDLMDTLLTLYQAQQTGIIAPTLQGAITAVSNMADKVNKILIGTGETIQMNQDKYQSQADEKCRAADERVNDIKAKNTVLMDRIEDMTLKYKAANQSLDEERDRTKTLEQMLDDKAALIDEYRLKIDTLETENRRQNTIVSDAEDHMMELEQLRAHVNEQDIKIQRLELDKEKQIETNAEAFRTEISTLKTSYENKLIQKDRELIELEKRIRQEMSDLQAGYTATLKEYEGRMLSVIEERDKQQQTQAQQTQTRQRKPAAAKNNQGKAEE